MAYSVTTNNGDVITVDDADKDSSSLSLTVIGRNATNYGQGIFRNTVRQLENFASDTAPSPGFTLTGQLWYDKGENTLRAYNRDATAWVRTSAVPVKSVDIQTDDDLYVGTQYFNDTENKLRVYDGAVFRDAVLPGGTVTSAFSGNVSASGSATNYGAKTETLFLKTTGSPSVVPVVAMKYVSDGSTPGETADTQHDSAGATVMAIFSDTAFTIHASDPYHTALSETTSFSAEIKKGMNLRADYTESTIAKANASVYADTAFKITTNNGVSNIAAADIIHVSSTNWVPSTTNSFNYTLGSPTHRFGNVHTDTITIGNGATPQEVGIIGTVNMGNATNRINSLFVQDLSIAGDLDFAQVNTLTGLEDAAISNVILTRGTIATTATASLDIVNYQTLQAATTSSSLVSGKVIVTAPASPAVSHSVFLGQGTSGNLDTRAHASLSYIPSTGTLSTTAVSATTFTGDLTGDVTGAIAGTTANMSGTVTGDTVTDGTLTINNGAITGAQGITSFATITGATLTDGTAQLTSGAITGATNITATGTVTANLFSGVATQARYADLAEKYTTDADYEAGTVVKIGGDAEITMTTEHADTEVFGVISTDPAYLMNKDIDGLPVALQGRVPVKVIGKVSKGQRLTSSDVPGLAWAVDENTPIQAIIGRSLENKTDGDQGVVEAVIGIK